MTNQTLGITLLAVSLTAIAAAQNGKSDLPVEAIPFCTVLENPDSYDGKEITVSFRTELENRVDDGKGKGTSETTRG